MEGQLVPGTTSPHPTTNNTSNLRTRLPSYHRQVRLNSTLTSIRTDVSKSKMGSCEELNSYGEESDSGNVLNVGFIAEDSPFSDSQSVRSDAFSISDVSAIRDMGGKPSPHFLVMEEEISGMEEWPAEKIDIGQRSFKRSNPAVQEERRGLNVGSRCCKKKVDDKMRVITINPPSEVSKGDEEQTGYLLRSRVRKIVQKGRSSARTVMTIIGSLCGKDSSAHS